MTTILTILSSSNSQSLLPRQIIPSFQLLLFPRDITNAA
jgi:hypothetical protein